MKISIFDFQEKYGFRAVECPRRGIGFRLTNPTPSTFVYYIVYYLQSTKLIYDMESSHCFLSISQLSTEVDEEEVLFDMTKMILKDANYMTAHLLEQSPFKELKVFVALEKL